MPKQALQTAGNIAQYDSDDDDTLAIYGAKGSFVTGMYFGSQPKSVNIITIVAWTVIVLIWAWDLRLFVYVLMMVSWSATDSWNADNGRYVQSSPTERGLLSLYVWRDQRLHIQLAKTKESLPAWIEEQQNAPVFFCDDADKAAAGGKVV
ncbi:MAG: hypothetical protein ACAI35_12945 [Candidatus Methylacidiphilales bacterium]|nr:hypothetical protein [Candidatus Methylacidiphilales bacterium]